MRVNVSVKCSDGEVRCLTANSADYVKVEFEKHHEKKCVLPKLRIHLDSRYDVNADKEAFKGFDKLGSKHTCLIELNTEILVNVETEE